MNGQKKRTPLDLRADTLDFSVQEQKPRAYSSLLLAATKNEQSPGLNNLHESIAHFVAVVRRSIIIHTVKRK